jgi:hypothetical protein
MTRTPSRLVSSLAFAGSLLACTGNDATPTGDGATTSGAGGVAAAAGGGSSIGANQGTGAGPVLSIGGGNDADDGGESGGPVCATVTSAATLEPVYLAFAFDVSGSMGKGDYPWHDASLKWDPVVAATRGFLEDQASTGLLASLTAFPSPDEDDRCEASTYATPDVAMVELPSSSFGEALAAIRKDDWRGGTPTRVAVQGVLDYIRGFRVEHPGHYALVLVTDGYPQGCDDDGIDAVQEVVRDAASEVPTYVIGVKNPPLVDSDGNPAPDTVSNLARVAEAGGTDRAFIIDTGDPDQTLADFRSAIDEIRGVALACNVDVPKAPDGRVFEKDQVVVGYASGAAQTQLVYDESCTAEGAWHYDDVAAPSQVVVCPATCSAVQAGFEAKLQVGFTCEPVINLPR